MRRTPLPHHNLLDQIQLNAVSLSHELPIVQSLIKWIQKTLHQKQDSHPIGWMFVSCSALSHSEQVEKIVGLNESLSQLRKSVKTLVIHVGSYAKHHKKIEKALFTLNDSFRKIPPIEHEIQLLKMNTSLFDEPDAVGYLLDYTEKTAEMLKKVSHLKQAIIDEVLHSLSATGQRIPK